MSYFINFYNCRHIIINMAKQDFKNKYRNSILGMAWSFLSPLGLVLVIGTVYSLVFKVPSKEFIPYVFSGIMPWTFISSVADISTVAFINSQGYIKQTQVPIEIFPARFVIGLFINLLISLLAYFLIYMIIAPEKFSLNMLMVLPSLFIWLIFAIGWANIVSIVNLYIRDYQPLQSIVFQALFYATPILYKVDMIPKEYEIIYNINPFFYMMEILRQPLLGNKILENSYFIIAASFSFITFILSILIIKRVGRNIAFKL